MPCAGAPLKYPVLVEHCKRDCCLLELEGVYRNPLFFSFFWYSFFFKWSIVDLQCYVFSFIANITNPLLYSVITTMSLVCESISVFFFSFFFFFTCSEFCHTLEWNSHGFTCVPHPVPHSQLRLHRLSLGFPSAPGPSTCLMHPTWAGDLFHPRYYTCFDAVLLKQPTLSFSHRV